MRIFDVNNIELLKPDLSRGYLKKDKLFVKRHEATEPVIEKWHYETIAQYPNGGKDVKKVIDVAAEAGREAWDEYEDIHRYIEYKEDENSTLIVSFLYLVFINVKFVLNGIF